MFEDLIRFIREWYETEGPVPLHEPRFGELERKYVIDAIDSTFVSSIGMYVDRFEKNLATYIGVNRAVATVNGTAALQVALRLVGVSAGDEVITQPITFVATPNAIAYNRAHPVFIDVDRETMGLSPEALHEFLDQFGERRSGGVFNRTTNRRIAAIVPMHTFGHPCRMNELMALANNWEIPIVEDAAEALGSYYKNKHCGTFGNLGIFSFNGNKIITSGGGGAIVTNDHQLADRAKHLTTTAKKDHPWEYIHDEIGYNFRMPNLNAALACAQLEQLNSFLKEKRKLANTYEIFFNSTSLGNFFKEPTDCRSNYWLNTVLLNGKTDHEAFLKHTNSARIMTRPLWHFISDLKMYRNCQTGSIENARWLQERAVNLPSSARNHE